MQLETPKVPADRILRLPEVLKKTGLSRSTIYARMREKNFPDQVDLGGRAVGWRKSDILAWLDSRKVKKPDALKTGRR